MRCDVDELTCGRSDDDIFFGLLVLVLGAAEVIYDGGMQMTRILSTTEVSRTTGRRKRGPKGWLGPWGPVGGIAGEHGAFGSRGIVFQDTHITFSVAHEYTGRRGPLFPVICAVYETVDVSGWSWITSLLVQNRFPKQSLVDA